MNEHNPKKKTPATSSDSTSEPTQSQRTITFDAIAWVPGKSGLYEVRAITRQGILLRSLTDGRALVAGATIPVSLLKDMAVYTASSSEPIGLREVFLKMADLDQQGQLQAPDNQEDAEAWHTFFANILPEYDRNRVHTSHIQRIYQWYQILKEVGALPEPPKAEEDQPEHGSSEQPENSTQNAEQDESTTSR